MAITPMGLNPQIDVVFTDENDPESPIEAAIWLDNGSDHQELAWTTPGQDSEDFFWLIESAAKYHNIPVVYGEGVRK